MTTASNRALPNGSFSPRPTTRGIVSDGAFFGISASIGRATSTARMRQPSSVSGIATRPVPAATSSTREPARSDASRTSARAASGGMSAPCLRSYVEAACEKSTRSAISSALRPRLPLPIPEEIPLGERRLLLAPRAVVAGGAALDPGLGVAADNGELLLEVVGLPLPVLGGAEVRPGGGEGGIVPAAGQPGGVVDDAESAQGLDPAQLGAVEE